MVVEYIVNLPIRFVKGIKHFFYFWYIKSSEGFWKEEILFIKQIERDIGIIINIKLIFKPIYGDYSYMGRVVGPIFRFGRVIVGIAIITVSAVFITCAYLIWIILPPLTFLMILSNLSHITEYSDYL